MAKAVVGLFYGLPSRQKRWMKAIVGKSIRELCVLALFLEVSARLQV